MLDDLLDGLADSGLFPRIAGRWILAIAGLILIVVAVFQWPDLVGGLLYAAGSLTCFLISAWLFSRSGWHA